MDYKILVNYQKKFNCKVTMNEPGGGYLLFDCEKCKLYNIEELSDTEIERFIKQSIKSGKNILLVNNLNNEIKRNCSPISEKIL